jgi:hypothetical protein
VIRKLKLEMQIVAYVFGSSHDGNNDWMARNWPSIGLGQGVEALP